MDTHSFSSPRPVPDSKVPTWEVDVLREGVDEPIATLIVNDETLPPRKNRKKTLWKLPSSYDQEPRFGEHEKKRLWEMFKQQKKLRRKLSKKGIEPCQPPPESGSTDTTIDTLEETEMIEEKNPEVSLCGPPPGLFSSLSMNDQHAAPPQESNEKPTLPSKSISEIPSTLPLPPPGMAPLVPPRMQPPELENQSTLQQHDQVPSRAFPQNCPQIGEIVAQTMIKCLHTQQMHIWVEYMAPTFHKLMVVGAAQAACQTHHDAFLQWQTLQQGQWTLEGFSTQPTSNGTLIIITGKTVQTNQKLLAFHETLILQQENPFSGCRIANEILNLVPLS